MGIVRGPNTVNDGLIFGFDTNYGVADDNPIATRFYNSDSTVNYLAAGSNGYGIVSNTNGWLYSGSVAPNFNIGSSEFGTPIGTHTVGGWLYSDFSVLNDDLLALSGQTVTFSIYLRKHVAGTLRMRAYDNVSNYSLTSVFDVTTGFQRYTHTHTVGTNPTGIRIVVTDGTGGGVIDFHSPQLEIGTKATPFVNGARTPTLTDLKRTTDIDLANVSFDSTGRPTFDGTDDYLQLNTKFLPATGPFTMEFLYQISTIGGRGGMFERNPSSPYNGALIGQGGSNNWAFQVNNGSQSLTISNMGYPSTNTWYHDIGVYNGVNTIKFYRNGSLISTVTGSTIGSIDSAGSRDNMRFMKRDSNSTTIGGKVAISKVYNRELSTQEAEQNYNAYKNRFNI